MLNQSVDSKRSKVESAPQCWSAVFRDERCEQTKNRAQTLRGAVQLYWKWPLHTLSHILENTIETQLTERFENECLPHRMLQQTHLFSQGCVFHKSCPHQYNNQRSNLLMYASLPLAVSAPTDSRRDSHLWTWTDFLMVVCVGVMCTYILQLLDAPLFLRHAFRTDTPSENIQL